MITIGADFEGCDPFDSKVECWNFIFNNIVFYFFLKKIISFIYLFLAVLGLHCCMWAFFSSCIEQGATLRCGTRASLCGGFSLLWSVGSRAQAQ